MPRRTITQQQAAFLKYEIETGDPRRQKVALQEVCRLFRSGARLAPEAQPAFEREAAYLAVNSADLKVVRWALNTIARLGTQQGAGNSVSYAIQRHAERPEIVAAAVAALAALYRGAIPNLPPGTNVRPEMRTLAAMQTVTTAQLGNVAMQVDIDTADPELLKLALIVIGLNRDIQHLLHPRHENGAIVRALGEHDDPIVRQYGVWAVIENRHLGLEHLGTPFARIQQEPANVQAKLLELGASSIPDLIERQTIIIEGSNLPSAQAREGLAKGLLRTFYDGVEGATLNWFHTERDPRVRLLLSEHFARYAGELPSYREEAIELARQGGDFRRHVLLGAEGTPLFRELRQDEAASSDLFDLGGDTEMKQLMAKMREEASTKVLVLNATPDDQERIRPDKEAAELRDRMAGVPNPRRRLVFDHLWASRLDHIQQELVRQDPKILHFSGHGSPGMLAFENRDGTTAPLEGRLLANILRAYGELECLVLHACYSEDVAEACLPHVPYVVGSVGAIDDTTAPAFTYMFYQALAGGRKYVQAFEMGQTEVALISESAARKYVMRLRGGNSR